MIDLKKLEAEREHATRDKADLFDFYHDNWDALVAEIERLRPKSNTPLLGKPEHPDYDPE